MAVGTNNRVKAKVAIEPPLGANKPLGRTRQLLYAFALELEPSRISQKPRHHTRGDQANPAGCCGTSGLSGKLSPAGTAAGLSSPPVGPTPSLVRRSLSFSEAPSLSLAAFTINSGLRSFPMASKSIWAC